MGVVLGLIVHSTISVVHIKVTGEEFGSYADWFGAVTTLISVVSAFIIAFYKRGPAMGFQLDKKQNEGFPLIVTSINLRPLYLIVVKQKNVSCDKKIVMLESIEKNSNPQTTFYLNFDKDKRHAKIVFCDLISNKKIAIRMAKDKKKNTWGMVYFSNPFN